MKLEYSRKIFENYSSRKFNENSSIGSRDFLGGQKKGETDIDMTKPKISFRSFSKAPKNCVELFLLCAFVLCRENLTFTYSPK